MNGKRMTCDDYRARIELLFRGKAHEDEALERHLAECPSCRSWWERKFEPLLDAVQVRDGKRSPGELEGKIKSLLRQEEEGCIFYDACPSPVGEILVASRGPLLCGLAIRPTDTPAFLRRLADRFHRPVLRQPEKLRQPMREIREYFSGRLRQFNLTADISWMTSFQRDVLQFTAGIPAGTVRTYGQVAQAIGTPGASRAVGNALGSNPVPIVIPCHRVVAASGRIGGYSGGGPEIKRRLLTLEGAPLPPAPRSLISNR